MKSKEETWRGVKKGYSLKKEFPKLRKKEKFNLKPHVKSKEGTGGGVKKKCDWEISQKLCKEEKFYLKTIGNLKGLQSLKDLAKFYEIL